MKKHFKNLSSFLTGIIAGAIGSFSSLIVGAVGCLAGVKGIVDFILSGLIAFFILSMSWHSITHGSILNAIINIVILFLIFIFPVPLILSIVQVIPFVCFVSALKYLIFLFLFRENPLFFNIIFVCLILDFLYNLLLSLSLTLAIFNKPKEMVLADE